jgi:hypothetical protein
MEFAAVAATAEGKNAWPGGRPGERPRRLILPITALALHRSGQGSDYTLVLQRDKSQFLDPVCGPGLNSHRQPPQMPRPIWAVNNAKPRHAGRCSGWLGGDANHACDLLVHPELAPTGVVSPIQRQSSQGFAHPLRELQLSGGPCESHSQVS